MSSLFLFCLCSVPLLYSFCIQMYNYMYVLFLFLYPFHCVLHIIILCSLLLLVDYHLAVSTIHLYCYIWLLCNKKFEYMYSDLDLVICISYLTAHRWVRSKLSNNHLNNPRLVHPCHLWRPQPLQLLIAAHCLVPLRRPLRQVLLPLERRSLLRNMTKKQQR